jgi:hypothetical protein
MTILDSAAGTVNARDNQRSVISTFIPINDHFSTAAHILPFNQNLHE